jgi:hypothetical protein
MTAVAAFFGYAQWRRQNLIAEIKRLRAVGYAMPAHDDPLSKFWPTMPTHLVLKCEWLHQSGIVKIGEREFTDDDMTEAWLTIQEQVKGHEVEEVLIQDWVGRPRNVARFKYKRE